MFKKMFAPAKLLIKVDKHYYETLIDKLLDLGLFQYLKKYW